MKLQVVVRTDGGNNIVVIPWISVPTDTQISTDMVAAAVVTTNPQTVTDIGHRTMTFSIIYRNKNSIIIICMDVWRMKSQAKN